MRPVIKWRPGENGVVATYNPHNDAKEKLLENFGNEPFYYCSYCDRVIPRVHIEVEHIQPVHYRADLEHSWSNFLLACKNCNLTKSDQNAQPANMLLPQFQNTWNCFIVNNDGTIIPNPHNILAINRANYTVQLLGMDRGIGHPNRQPQDDRYDSRRHVLMIAKRDLKYYEAKVPDYIIAIREHAIAMGFWYVWMQVFEPHPEVQDQLIDWFNNTYQNCRNTNVDRQ